MVVLRSISLVMTPPSVSIPSDSGVTSSKRTSLTSPCSTPAWIAAPIATTSSGLTPLCGSRPKQFLCGFLDFRHPGLAAHQHDFVDVGRPQTRVFQRRLARIDRALDQVVDQGLALRSRELDVQ